MIAVIAGATGLVGSQLVTLLLEDTSYSEVKIFVRRKTGLLHPKLSEFVVDFDKPEDFSNQLTGDVLFLCMGTTLATAGSKEKQYKVDFTYQYNLAQFAINNGVNGCVLISAAGANSSSSNFYLRMKGELDDAINNCNFEFCSILRPGQLYGNRTEKRISEKMALSVMFFFNKIGLFKKYKPIHAKEVAVAMLHLAEKKSSGVYTLNELFHV